MAKKSRARKFGIGGLLRTLTPGLKKDVPLTPASVLNPENHPIVGGLFKNKLAQQYDFILNPAHDAEQWVGLRDEYGEGTGYNAKDPSQSKVHAEGGKVSRPRKATLAKLMHDKPDPNSPSNDLVNREALPDRNATEEAWARRQERIAREKERAKAPFSNDTVESAAKRGAIRESAYRKGGKVKEADMEQRHVNFMKQAKAPAKMVAEEQAEERKYAKGGQVRGCGCAVRGKNFKMR